MPPNVNEDWHLERVVVGVFGVQSAAVGRRRTARFFEPQYSHASASPAAEAISDEGRPRRRSVKNRRTFSISRGQSRTRSSFAEARKRLRKRTFDCFKSAEGIRFSVVARPTPKSFHRGTFWLHLLGDKRWKYHTKYLQSAGLRGPQPLPRVFCGGLLLK